MNARGVCKIAVSAGLVAFVFLPLGAFMLASFETKLDMLNGWPTALTVINYRSLLNRGDVGRSVRDSIIIATLGAVLALGLAIPCAFFVSRRGDRVAESVWSSSVILWLVPPVALSLEVYFWFVRLGLYDRLLGLVLFHGAINATLALLLLRPFLEAIPRSVDEAAWMDGLRGFRLLSRVHMPATRRIIGGVMALCFVLSWNELLFGLIITDTAVRPLSTLVLSMTTGSSVQWGELAALGTIGLLPAVGAGVIYKLLARLRRGYEPARQGG
jgi:multiple sugar transport system permease protein